MARAKSIENLKYMQVKIKQEDKEALEELAQSQGFYSLSDFVRVTLMKLVRDAAEKKAK